MGTFTDPRDGKTYKTVTIGKQTWLAENLKYEASSSKYYDNNPANGQKYGRLYDWETAKKACPTGWHLPSINEWQELVNFAGGDEVAGKKLKATSGWVENGNGTDEYGFAALPAGSYGYSGRFYGIGNVSYGWSSTEDDATKAYIRHMFSHTATVGKGSYNKSDLFPVRCVQD